MTTVLFNHTWTPWNDRGDVKTTEMQVLVHTDMGGVEQAKAIMQEVGISGEIRNISKSRDRLTIRVWKPGYNASIQVHPESGMAVIEQGNTDFWNALMYLHKSPGPHNAMIRGNWIFTKIWTYLVDGIVYLILFLTASGIYMWVILKAERKLGLMVMGAGCFTFVAIVSALVL